MASEAASSGWRASWRLNQGKHVQKFALSQRAAVKVQEMLGVPREQELLHSTTAAFDHMSIRVHGHLLIYSETIAFYAKVFGTQVKKARASPRALRVGSGDLGALEVLARPVARGVKGTSGRGMCVRGGAPSALCVRLLLTSCVSCKSACFHPKLLSSSERTFASALARRYTLY
eukprot:4701380-Pleurochrysis_carterae.AAC.1